MDFVVVGLGLGALALLGGVFLAGWSSWHWARQAASATTAEEAAHLAAVAATRRGAGQALLGAGSAVLLATIGALAGSLTDQTGAFLVVTTATVAALGFLFWAYLHRLRSPIPPRPVHAARSARQPANGPDPARPRAPEPLVAPMAAALPTDAAAADQSPSAPAQETESVAAPPLSAVAHETDPRADDDAALEPEPAATPELNPEPDPEPDTEPEPEPEPAPAPEASEDENAVPANGQATSRGIVDLVAYSGRANRQTPGSGLDDDDSS